MKTESSIYLKDYPDLYEKASKNNDLRVLEEKMSPSKEIEWNCYIGAKPHSFKKTIKRMLKNSSCVLTVNPFY